jgi:hypothetical protein
VSVGISSDLRSARDTVIRAHLDAENVGDVPATLATFARPSYEVMPLGTFADAGLASTGRQIDVRSQCVPLRRRGPDR